MFSPSAFENLRYQSRAFGEVLTVHNTHIARGIAHAVSSRLQIELHPLANLDAVKAGALDIRGVKKDMVFAAIIAAEKAKAAMIVPVKYGPG